jgi:SNF2 family DNA or RNA helicase
VQARERPSARTPQPRAGAATASVPLLPTAAPLAKPPLSLTALDAERLAQILDGPRSDAVHLSLALRAHALSAAADFQDLISLATLRGVDSHVYQTETVRRVLRVLRGRALLADEVGLGKTIEALMVLREYQLRGMARRALVLAPPALVRHWAGELESKAGVVARTTEDARLREEPDAFWREDGVVVASLALARGGRHASAVQAAPWDIVVVDEAHHVKNRQTAGWKLVDGIKSRFLLLLTATPVETDLEEIYNLVTLLKPGLLTTPAEFRRQFVDARDPTTPRDTERLRRLLGDVMVRNTRAQSGLALPPRYVSTVAIEPSQAEREVYDATLSLLRAHSSEPKTRLVTSTLLLEAGSSLAALRGTLARMGAGEKHSESMRDGAARLARLVEKVEGSGKLDALLDIVQANDGRVLVFTRFRDTLEHIAGGLRGAGVDVALFHGGMRAEERHNALSRFRDGAKVLLATDVGGEGQNLQFCQTLVNFDLPWNPMRIEQRIGRLHRMGQTGEVRVFNLCARGTAEDRVLDVLDRRLHLFELVVGEMDMVLGNLSDERDLEERILEIYATARGDDDVTLGFDRIAEELANARGRYERVRALDEALFRTDFEA